MSANLKFTNQKKKLKFQILKTISQGKILWLLDSSDLIILLLGSKNLVFRNNIQEMGSTYKCTTAIKILKIVNIEYIYMLLL